MWRALWDFVSTILRAAFILGPPPFRLLSTSYALPVSPQRIIRSGCKR